MATEGSEQTVVSPPRAERNKRLTRTGVVTSAARDKTIKVTVSFQTKHRKYGKHLRQRMVLHAHDEQDEAVNGDLVEIVECRPLSKTKHWRLIRILARAPRQATEGAS
ncbi:MAG: 30S ribosomal protein S17 [Planctomycetota bacterium]